jgi:nucleoside-diphosphate-sugar epimerase
MNKIVVLGGSGFLGKSLMAKLHSEHIPYKTMIHSNDVLGRNIEKFKGNILSEKTFLDELSSQNIIINLVGQYDMNISKFIDLNMIGGLNLLNSCLKKKIKRIILISSINVYGENLERASLESDMPKPSSHYGIIKLMTEKLYEYYSMKYKLNITIIRLANLYGPDKKSGYVANLITSVKNDRLNTAFNKGKQSRDLLYVDDATEGIVKTIKIPIKGFSVLNISSGRRYAMKEIINIIQSISNKKLRIKYVDETPDEKSIWASNLKAKKILGFAPKVTLKEGLQLTINQLLK